MRSMILDHPLFLNKNSLKKKNSGQGEKMNHFLYFSDINATSGLLILSNYGISENRQ